MGMVVAPDGGGRGDTLSRDMLPLLSTHDGARTPPARGRPLRLFRGSGRQRSPGIGAVRADEGILACAGSRKRFLGRCQLGPILHGTGGTPSDPGVGLCWGGLTLHHQPPGRARVPSLSCRSCGGRWDRDSCPHVSQSSEEPQDLLLPPAGEGAPGGCSQSVSTSQVLTLKPNDGFPSQDLAAPSDLPSGCKKGSRQWSLFMGFPGRNAPPVGSVCIPPELGEARRGVAIKGAQRDALSTWSIALFPDAELPSQQLGAFRNWGGGT